VRSERRNSASEARGRSTLSEAKWIAEPLKRRGVSSTAKLPVSKTGLGGSNPSAPAKFECTKFEWTIEVKRLVTQHLLFNYVGAVRKAWTNETRLNCQVLIANGWF
jgi:hypothetical protein